MFLCFRWRRAAFRALSWPLPGLRLLAGLCLLAGLWLGLAAAARAASPEPVLLDGRLKTVALAGHSQWWVDPQGRLDVQQVEAAQDTLPFAVREPGQRQRLGEHGVLWVRFDAWTQDRSTHWDLELARSGTDLVQLYYRGADGQWQTQQAGDRLAVRDWSSPDRFPVFALDSRADGPVTYWLRIEHARVPFSGELFIHTHSHLREQRILQQFLLGGYFGMALLLMAVALANGVVFRDRSFDTYAAYISLLALSLAASLGVGGQFLWPGSAAWNGLAEFVLLPLVAVAGLLFVRQVVQPRRIGRWLNRLSLALAALLVGLVLVDVLLPTQTSFMALTVTASLTMLLVYAMLLAGWRTGERWVRWIALGILPVLLAGTLPILRNLNLLSSGFLSQYGLVMAAALEGPLLIYGLLQRSSLQHEAQTRAKALKITEPLTGLTNRRNAMLRLHDCLVRAERYEHHCALLLIELDNHGWFLSEHGREVADRALVLTGSLLRSVARDVDTAARITDKGFMLLMEGPVRGPQAVAAATSIVAGGLRPSTQLPVGASLRYKVVVALLPDPGLELMQDAQAHLHWLGNILEDLRRDKRKSIQTVNF